MESRELGRSGTQVPAIGIGTWRYDGGIGPLKEGILQGACFLDTAEAYGTEGTVGQVLGMFNRSEIFLATKVSPRHFKYSDVIKSANESLRQLQTDYIDLYQLHWPNY